MFISRRLSVTVSPARLYALQTLLTHSNWLYYEWLLRGTMQPARPWLKTSDSLEIMASGAGDLDALPPQCGLGARASVLGAGDEESDEAARLGAEELLQAVCRYVPCPVPACAKPVRPHLHCCYECGE